MKQAALDHLVKLAKEANDSDRWWEFADGIDDEVSDAVGEPRARHRARGKSSANDGSQAELQEISDRIVDEIGILYTVNALRNYRATAQAWPVEERDPEVEFRVHRQLRGDKAKAQLAMYKRRAAADYKRSPGLFGSPRLTEHRLKFYRADERPAQSVDEVLARRIRGLLKKALSPGELDQIEAVFARECRDRRKALDQ